jgi:hypothetical protein
MPSKRINNIIGAYSSVLRCSNAMIYKEMWHRSQHVQAHNQPFSGSWCCAMLAEYMTYEIYLYIQRGSFDAMSLHVSSCHNRWFFGNT